VTRIVEGAGALVLLATPTAIAFFSGGYFDEPRLVAGIVAWALVAVAAVTVRRPLPSSRPGLVAVGGLAGLAAWTGFSVTWAPLRGPAFGDFQRLLVYVAVLTAAAALLRQRAAARGVEPALAAGALVVILYGLSERLLPGVVHLARSASAGGRLEQPLTYWNAMGLLATLGFVLCVRIAGDASRLEALRGGAAAATVPLGLAVYLSFSRGALVALAVGLVVLVLALPTRAQLRAAGLSLAGVVPASVVASALPAVRGLSGSIGGRELQGAAMLALLTVMCAAMVAAQRRLVLAAPSTTLRVRRRMALYVAVVLAMLSGAALAAGLHERHGASSPAFGANPRRLGSVATNRSDYWAVAFRTFAHHPLRGHGSASFQVDWARERTIPDPAKDAHSLYIETAAELGLVGLALLAGLLSGVGACAVRAHRRLPQLSTGWIAALCAWAVHAGLDWDWEMPAVALIGLVLAGALIASVDQPVGARGSAAAAPDHQGAAAQPLVAGSGQP
jgi:O-Antigen ligase